MRIIQQWLPWCLRTDAIRADCIQRPVTFTGKCAKGAAQIAKMLGYYAPTKVKTKVVVDTKECQNKLASMSDAELHEILDADL